MLLHQRDREAQMSGDYGPTSANLGVPTRTSLRVRTSSSLVMPWGSLGGWSRRYRDENKTPAEVSVAEQILQIFQVL